MASQQLRNSFRFAIDRGGTFTDVYAECPNGKVRVMKLLSEDPDNYQDAPREGIRRILQEETGIKFPSNEPIDPSYIEWIRMGTTVATNALLERKGERMALAVTKGYKDLLHIGNQTRPKIFDLKVLCPEVLYEEIIEVHERVIPFQDDDMLPGDCEIVEGTLGDKFKLVKSLDRDALRKGLENILKKGIKSLAVALMHSYIYDEHEREVGEIARELGFEQVSLSSGVMPMVRIVPRGYTACADAYLTPCIKRYVSGFASGFKDQLKNLNVSFMQSDGGLTPVSRFCGSKAILSGPAGGVVGYAVTTYGRETNKPVIGFDMGGTSTDVSRYDGHYEHVFETTTAGITIQAPQLDINTVAAGGGSRLFFRSGAPAVGPESAGAHPGPVCYRKDGYLAVTDVNLVLGRLLPEYFPNIFGPNEDQPLDKEGAIEAFTNFTKEVNDYIASQSDGKQLKPYTVMDLALGFVQVANESMCRPIRNLTEAQGHDTSKHVLACFGGAGGQHACAIARSLGMSTVFIHKYAGILSAYGIALADIVHEAQEPCTYVYEPESFPYLDKRIDILTKMCRDELIKEGLSKDCISTEVFLNLRYDRTDCALMCNGSSDNSKNSCKHGNFEKSFLERYHREFGFDIPGRKIYVDDIRVRGVGKSSVNLKGRDNPPSGPPKPKKITKCYFEDGYDDTSVYFLEEIATGYDIPGPAIIIDKTNTIVVEPFCTASVTKEGDVRIEIGVNKNKTHIGTELDRIQLAIFSHRFMSTAEQMGRVLQRTSISTNIKERLDFSCAMFGPDGGLVANAPHIPVHLGSMQETVQYQIRNLGDDLKEGDVILTNHPVAGGTHLPDLTVITPVFYEGEKRPVFYVASRGHHADIGGLAPGSMPPNSKTIFHEGAVFKSFKLVTNGQFQEEALTEALMAPQQYPGCSGTRNLQDNKSDLRAQVAANKKGITLIKELIDEYGLKVVQAYMGHIQQNAEDAVREMLKEMGRKFKNDTGQTSFSAEEFLDDGSAIKLTVSIDIDTGSAVFDFNGTGPEIYGNLNAPRAITHSAIIYCLRCMVDQDIPLNQGCLYPVTVKIPDPCLLSPSVDAAVVGGNVLTCQRVVDVIFKAFRVCAASQGCMNITAFGDETSYQYIETLAGGSGAGCMNNVLFGDDNFGYYETIAGGAGAGPTWDGRSGVHVHMTNTRITDPEILECRYPVVLQCFHLRSGSGGRGKHVGGEGVVRELMFRRPIELSVLSERRAFQPFGLEGGGPGARGLNLLIQNDGRVINIGGKTLISVKPGECFRIQTPGGGGYGKPSSQDADELQERPSKRQKTENATQLYMERGSLFNYKLMQESA